jgi:hypothetical protein
MAPRPLARTLPKITRPALEKRGAAFAALIAGWNDALGAALAQSSLPERLTQPGGVLTVRVAGGGAALEFQHLQTQIVERLNAYLGFAAVSRIALRQAPMPIRSVVEEPPAPGLSAAAARDIAAAVGGVEDPELRARLEQWGRAIAVSRRQND